jgi:rubrerythrin
MRVHSAVLSTLALLSPLATTGCPSTYGCDPPSEQFNVNQPVTGADIQALINSGWTTSDTWNTLDCNTLCRDAYRRTRGWETGKISNCNYTLPEKLDGTGALGNVTCSGTGYQYLCEGRRPLEHTEAGDDDCVDILGRNLAAMAYLEASSVIAFEQLAAWLQARRAPRELVERCLAAAEDERYHAVWLTQFATERGANVPVPTNSTIASEPSVFEVALHNAVEGCVHESFAALMAAIRAKRAGDVRLRRVFARLSEDESRHGQLAWDLHDWLTERLEPAQVRLVEQRRREALDGLPDRARELQRRLPQALGYLGGEEAERLALSFAMHLAA